MPEKDKIPADMRKEIYEWKSKKGEKLPDSTKKVSPYTVAPMFGISHTMVYLIWKEGPERKTPISGNPTDTKLAGKLVALFGEAIADIPDELKTKFLSNLSDTEKERIRGLRS
jgi:hypothetical protein